jgi:hypothetical protein
LFADGGDHAAGIVPYGARLPARSGPRRDEARQAQYAIIAAVKGWHAACLALPLWLAHPARAAEDLNGAARELARKTAVLAKAEPVTTAWRNLSSLGSPVLAQARGAFEAALREAGGRTGDQAGVEAQLTLSETQAEYLLVAEIRKGEERQVWIASWKRAANGLAAAPPAVLEKRLVWEQDEAILDVALAGDLVWVLSPSRLAAYRAGTPVYAVRITPPKPWPRDLRGRLRVNGANVQAYLPGMLCSGAANGGLVVECRSSDEMWTIESGTRSLLLAAFAANRDYFDGRVVTQTGMRKTVAPFYSAAEVEEGGRQMWLLAMVDGRTAIFDASFEAVGAIPSWGSDIAGTDARCGGRAAVLATRPGDGHEGDAVEAFAIVNRAASPVGVAVELPGRVTALWSGANVMAVVRNAATGKYQAYVLTIACS